jgi:hypothetical protein
MAFEQASKFVVDELIIRDNGAITYPDGTIQSTALDHTKISMWFYRKFVSGYNYWPPNSTLSTGTVSLNRQYFFPFFVPTTTTFTRLGIYVPTGNASSVARLGIYASDANDVPSTLLLDAGTVSRATSGSSVFVTIDQTLTSGLYWLSIVPQGAGTSYHTMDTYRNTQFTPANLSSSLARNESWWIQTGITGALSDANPTLTQATGSVPAIAIGL